MGPARWVVFLVASFAPFVAHAKDEQARALRFDEVLQSVNTHDPRVRAAVERLRNAEAATISARGAFDPRIEGDAKLTTGAYYDLRRADVALRQPTSIWGSELYVGYRVGVGINERWPTYLDDQTLAGGEIRAGLELPIWRGGPIDEQRAERARAIRLEEAAGHGLATAELDLELAAARAYWKWVSTGQSRKVAEALLRLAEERDGQLRRRLSAGSIAEFDVLDNERILLERREFLVAAERAFEQAAFELSLFLRDAAGRSVVPAPERLPEELGVAPLTSLNEQQAIEHVLMCHPELRRARAELGAVEVDLALAKNQLAPDLKAAFEYSRDLGSLTGTSLDFTLPGNVFEAGVKLTVPLPFRTERGRTGVARARLAEKQAELQLLEDQLGARTRDAASAVRAAQERAGLVEEAVETAAELAEGERRRFEVGASNLIFVNLREQQAAMARIQYIDIVAIAEIERIRWETTTRVECG